MKVWLILLVLLLLAIPALCGHDNPKIAGQKSLTVQQGQSITIMLSDLYVEFKHHDDDGYPNGYYVVVSDGKNYSFSEATVTPDAGFIGTLSVPIRVSNGKKTSKKFPLKITVTAIENARPVITGQVPLEMRQGESITIELQDLVVSDPDNDYPGDFTMKIIKGDHYTSNKNTVTPDPAFYGTLTVDIKVNDGQTDSPVFPLKIDVKKNKAPANIPPVITGQSSIKIHSDESITVQFSHLKVQDPDNDYPEDFSLNVLSGPNYSLEGKKVTPSSGFTGTLAVPVTVHDGIASSPPFSLKINVEKPATLKITGQRSMIKDEDSAIAIMPADLIVDDPQKTYPANYFVMIKEGNNYSAHENLLQPARDYFGTLTVPVQVSNGKQTSAVFEMSIEVSPVNDRPTIALDSSTIRYEGEMLTITPNVVISDVDDTTLLQAVISFAPEYYQAGHDVLSFEGSEFLSGFFDQEAGVLVIANQRPLADYQSTLRSIRYQFRSEGDTLPSNPTRLIRIRVSDGKDFSEEYEKTITLLENVDLFIPTGFTPNNDNANDTWVITPLDDTDSFDDAILRIYNKHGVQLFEATGFQHSWDGRINGDVLPADTYFYTIELNTAFERKLYKGVVTILR